MAASLDDLLASSKRIEALLGKSSGTVGSLGRTTPKAAGTNQVTGQGNSNDDKNQKKSFKATTASLSDLGDAADGLNRKFSGLGKTVDITRGNFVAMNRSMRATYRGKNVSTTGGSQRIQATKPGQGATIGNPAGPMQSFFQRVFGRNSGGVGGQVESSLQGLVSGLSYTKSALIAVASELIKGIEPVVKDFFALREAGIDATSALGGLYIDAAKSGMSLAEYTKVIQESNAVVSRSTSMDDFNKKLQSSISTLANFGIYGESATKMASELASQLTVSGIAQKDLTSVSDPLLKQFGSLQASMGLSIGQFEELTKSLFENESVQSELMGLDQSQRAGRIQELARVKFLGVALGGTAKQSQALAQAMLDQRNAPVEDLFKQAGVIRQFGAANGLNNEDVDRYAQLNQLGESRTADESAEMAKLAVPIQKALQQGLSSRDIGTRYMAQQFQNGLGGANGILKAAGAVGLTADSGPNQGVNKQFSQGAGSLEKGAGLLLTYAEGISKNPAIGAIISAIGSAVSTLSTAFVLKKVLGGGGVAAKVRGAGTAVEGVEDAAGAGKGASSVVRGIKTGWGAILDSISWFATGVSKTADATLDAGQWLIKIGGNIFKGFQVFGSTVTDSAKLSEVVGRTVGTIGNVFQDSWKLMEASFSGIKSTLGTFMSSVTTSSKAVESTADTIGGVGKAVADSSKVLEDGVGGVGKALAGGGEVIAEGGGIILKSLRVFSKAFPYFAMILDGVIEAFTGEIATALDPKAGMLSRIEGVITAAVASIPQMIIDGLSYVFGDELIKPLQVVFDILKAGIVQAVNGVMRDIVTVVSVFTDLLPDESKLKKFINTSKKSLNEAVETNGVLISDLTWGLMEGQPKTMKEISAANSKAADDADKKSKDATAKVTAAATSFDNVMYGTNGITSSIVDAAAMVGTPGPQAQSGVTPPAVNTPDDVAAKQAAATVAAQTAAQVAQNGTTPAGTPGVPAPDMASQLERVIAILQQQLDIEKAHAATSDAMLRNNDKTYFPDTGTMFNRVNALA